MEIVMLFACILVGVALAGGSLPGLCSVLLFWPALCILARLVAPTAF
jgi:hypothetical protein